jgi:hypothetical protein
MTDKFRHIDTTGLPDGFDVADLIESGVVGEELIAWCKARVRPGPPSLTKEEMRASKPAKPVDIEKKKAVPAQVAGNVVALPEPEPPPILDLPPEFSEDQLANDFTKRHYKTLAYCASWKSWLQWDENRWNTDDTHLAGSQIDYTIRGIDNPGIRVEHRRAHNMAPIRTGYTLDSGKTAPGGD